MAGSRRYDTAVLQSAEWAEPRLLLQNWVVASNCFACVHTARAPECVESDQVREALPLERTESGSKSVCWPKHDPHDMQIEKCLKSPVAR